MTRRLTRRATLGASLAVIAAPALALAPTPRQTAGPFYPAELPLDRDNDLVRVDGHAGSAAGTVIEVTGRVLGADGAPVDGALVEIWQADARGRYHHPRDRGTPDPAFQGFGQARAASDGAWRFRTIRPAAYGSRTPHIHFRIVAPDGRELVTQMYFAGESMNERDFLYRSLGSEEARRAVTVAFDATAGGTPAGYFPIVIA